MNRKFHSSLNPLRLVTSKPRLPLPREKRPNLIAFYASSESEPLPPLRKDQQVVREFRQKMRRAEDLITKLAFSLREIQGVWHKA